MRAWTFLLVALATAACNDVQDLGGNEGGGGADTGGAAEGGGGGDTDPVTAGSGTGGADEGAGGGASTSGGGPGGTDAPGSSPPAGYAKCGEGTFGQAESAAACEGFAANAGPQPPDLPLQCDALTISSGAWEAWCAPEGVYLWARFDGAEPTSAYDLCDGVDGDAIYDLAVNQGWYVAEIPGSGAGGDVVLDTYDLKLGATTSVSLETLVTDPALVEQGSGYLWLTPFLKLDCATNAYGPRFIGAGTALSWDAP